MRKNKYFTEHDYINNEDLLKKLGYRLRTSKLGSLGRALIRAGKTIQGLEWLNSQVDTMFKKVREEKNGKTRKGDSRTDARHRSGRHRNHDRDGLAVCQGS